VDQKELAKVDMLPDMAYPSQRRYGLGVEAGSCGSGGSGNEGGVGGARGRVKSSMGAFARRRPQWQSGGIGVSYRCCMHRKGAVAGASLSCSCDLALAFAKAATSPTCSDTSTGADTRAVFLEHTPSELCLIPLAVTESEP
jgi:hypothetical protein